MSHIPEQLRTQPLIRVCRPECKSHQNCTHAGKRPVSSTNNIRPIGEIRNWLQNGGNYGVVPKAENNLIVLDSDSETFTELAQDLPETFTVKTGSGNYHFYFYSEFSSNKSFKTQSSEFGSIRADNWHTVGVNSVHPDTGNKYQTAINTEINVLSESDVREFINSLENRLESQSSREDGGGGGGGGGSVFTDKTAEDLETEPTEQTLRTLGFINSDSKRTQIAKVLDAEHPERQIRVWACSFLYSAVGLTQKQIEKLLRESAEWAYDENRIEIEIRSLVRSSINNNKAPESVNLEKFINHDDMDLPQSESRKTESSGIDGSRERGGENTMPTFEDKESVQVKAGDSDGDRAIQATKVEGQDGSDEFEFVSIRKGRVQEVELTNGESGLMIDIDQTSSKSVGGTQDLDLVIEALQELQDEIQ